MANNSARGAATVDNRRMEDGRAQQRTWRAIGYGVVTPLPQLLTYAAKMGKSLCHLYVFCLLHVARAPPYRHLYHYSATLRELLRCTHFYRHHLLRWRSACLPPACLFWILTRALRRFCLGGLNCTRHQRAPSEPLMAL